MLNDNQREQLSNSIWVINTVLKEQGLQGNTEMFSIASLFLSNAIQKYDPNRGVKWTTYAYRSLSLYIKRVNAKENMRAYKIVSDNKLFYIKDSEDFEQDLYFKYLIGQIRELLTPREQEVLDFKLNGVSTKEMIDKLGLSHERIRQIWNGIKVKVRENIDFEP